MSEGDGEGWEGVKKMIVRKGSCCVLRKHDMKVERSIQKKETQVYLSIGSWMSLN